MRYRREIEVEGEPVEVFAYLADFEHAAEWDPGIVEARRLSEGPTRVGSRFEVIALFRGNRQRFEYVVTALEEARRVALRGEGDRAASDDEITVTPGLDGRTRVAYEADLRLKGCTGSPSRSSARPSGGWATTPSTGSGPGSGATLRASRDRRRRPPHRGGDARHRRDRPRRRRLRERRAGRARRGNLEHLARVARAAARAALPRLRFVEVRYRVKSWQRLDLCVEDARAAARRRRRRRAARCCSGSRWAGRSRSRRGRAVRRARARTRALDPRPAARSSRCAAGVSTCCTDRSTGGCPGVPGVARELATRLRAGALTRRRRELRADPGALHGIAVRVRGHPVPLPRAGAWARRIEAELDAFLRGRARAALAGGGVGHAARPTRARGARARGSATSDRSSWKRSRPWPRRGGEGVVVVVPALAERRAARRASCSAPRPASGSPAGRTCGRPSSR